MDKKSFLRGFGTGVLFAAVILGISFSVRTSKKQIIAQAKKYGMDFQRDEEKLFSSPSPEETAGASISPVPSAASPTATSDNNKDKNDGKVNQNPSQAPTVKPKQTQKASATPKPTKKADSSKNTGNKNLSNKKKEMEREKEDMKKSIEEDKKKLTISAGEWSDSVSRKLLGLGVIKSARDFDIYLNRYGYSSRIVAGTYDVSASDSYAELAKKITGGR